MTTSLYLACPAFAMNGPLERQNNIDCATWVAQEMGWSVTVSPLLSRLMGNGAWLPLKDRAADLRVALRHDVIWGCRGGYGSIELLPTLLSAKIKHAPMLMGYSDITALHAGFQIRGWFERIYGRPPAPGFRDGRTGTSLLACLRGEPLTFDGHFQAGVRVQHIGSGRGRLFPACLSVLASLCGTPAMPDLNGCILAIEDVKIHPFLVATHLNQLYLSGALRGIRGIIGGSLTHLEDHDYWGPSPDEILAEWGARLKVPTLSRLPFGHVPDALALPYNRDTRITAERNGQWNITIKAAG